MLVSCLCLCLCMYTYGVRTHGARLSHLVMYSFKSPSFLPPFSLRWVVFGISCHVPFVLISRVWRPLFIFLHLYFRPCSRDVGIFFPALCACIVHDVCMYIYIYTHPFRCDCHSPCHLRQVMPNFCRESKVTSRRIFATKIWYATRMP